MGKAVFILAVALGVAAALGLAGWLLFRNPAALDLRAHPFGDPAAATSDADVAALKILNGAERAFKKGLPETALRFYDDVDLRFSHTSVYERYGDAIWEEMGRCHAALGRGGDAAARFIEGRRALHARWLKLRAGPRTRADLEAFLKELPPDDGRRLPVETLLAP